VNCEAFKKAGGNAILIPRYWNQNFEHRKDPMKYIAKELNKITGD